MTYRDEEELQVHHHSEGVEAGLLAGAISGVVGWLGTSLFNSAKLIPFDREVAKRTRADILGRGGLGAGISESGTFNGASGMGNHIIEEAHRFAVIEEPGFGYAKRITQMGGRGTVGFLAGTVAAVAGLGAYLTFRKHQPESHYVPVDRPVSMEAANDCAPSGTHKKWQESVQKETSQDQGRSA